MSHRKRVVLRSVSRANDAGYLAANDLSEIATSLAVEYRLVGGNAVSLLVAFHGVRDRVPARETADADLGASFEVVADPRLVQELARRGYTREGGNRFTREVAHGATTADLTVDVLAPSYEGRLKPNQQHGGLFVDEVPGLALALARPATQLTVEVVLTTGVELTLDADVADVVSSLCMKAYGYAGRYEPRDASDIWRLLEAASAAGVRSGDWPAGASAREAAQLIRRSFGRPGGGGLGDISRDPAIQTRVRALAARVIGT